MNPSGCLNVCEIIEMLQLLSKLSAAGQDLQLVADDDDIEAKLAIVQRVVLKDSHITMSHKLANAGAPDFWKQLQTQKVVMAEVAGAFSSIITLAPQPQALRAAAIYTSLLKTPGCPVCFFSFCCSITVL